MQVSVPIRWPSEARGQRNNFDPGRVTITTHDGTNQFRGGAGGQNITIEVWSSRAAAHPALSLSLSAQNAQDLSDQLFDLANKQLKAETAAAIAWEAQHEERLAAIRADVAARLDHNR